MPDNSDEKSLVKITDLFGVAKPLEQLVSAIERGIGNLMRPIQKRRETKAEIASYNDWTEAIVRTGLSPKAAKLTLGERATVRLSAESIRQQENRESVAIEAVNEHLHSLEDTSQTLTPTAPIEPEWLDRFWRLAQDVTDSDMQTVWGRILSRQAQTPGKYSARSLEALSLLSKTEASELERLSKYLHRTAIHKRDVSYFLYRVSGSNNAGELRLIDEGLRRLTGDFQREIFGPAGLYSDSGSGWALDAPLSFENGKSSFWIADERFQITKEGLSGDHIIGAGLGVTPVGSEIFSLIKSSPDPEYVRLIKQSLSIQGYTFAPC